MKLNKTIIFVIVVVIIGTANCSFASLASAGERVMKDLLARIQDGSNGQEHPRLQRPTSNIIQDQSINIIIITIC